MATLMSTIESLVERLRAGALPACSLTLALFGVPPCQAADSQWPAITEPPTSRVKRGSA
jgi:hypothetical protein